MYRVYRQSAKGWRLTVGMFRFAYCARKYVRNSVWSELLEIERITK